MAQTIVTKEDYVVSIHGGLDVDGIAVLSDTLKAGATVCASTVTVSGALTANKLELVQAVSGTETTAWVGGTAPVIRVGQTHFTFTSGASTFRVPCWPAA
jgi:hypothetical protein